MPHSTTHHFAARPSGRTAARRASGAAPAARPELRGAVSRIDCEDGCHYCQGPETD